MKIVPKYIDDGIPFEELTPGTAFWWVDQLLVKIQFEDEIDMTNAISLHDGGRYLIDEERLVRIANVKVVEQKFIEV